LMAIEKIILNGEITFDTKTSTYTVWEKNTVVCVTKYFEIAKVALETFNKHYL